MLTKFCNSLTLLYIFMHSHSFKLYQTHSHPLSYTFKLFNPLLAYTILRIETILLDPQESRALKVASLESFVAYRLGLYYGNLGTKNIKFLYKNVILLRQIISLKKKGWRYVLKNILLDKQSQSNKYSYKCIKYLFIKIHPYFILNLLCCCMFLQYWGVGWKNHHVNFFEIR